MSESANIESWWVRSCREAQANAANPEIVRDHFVRRIDALEKDLASLIRQWADASGSFDRRLRGLSARIGQAADDARGIELLRVESARAHQMRFVINFLSTHDPLSGESRGGFGRTSNGAPAQSVHAVSAGLPGLGRRR